MENNESINQIDGKIRFLQIQKELIDSEKWDDRTHLDNDYNAHLNSFDSVVRYLCSSVGIFRIREMNEKNGIFTVKDQNGEKVNFDISEDYNGERGEDKLICNIEFNEKTKARALLHYSPTKGTAFEYSANLLPKNVQLGNKDFLGKSIEEMIKNIGSATQGIYFNTNVKRFSDYPNGLNHFYISTKDFVKGKEKQGDVISIISTLDGIVRGLQGVPFWVYGENFRHEKQSPLFSVKILGEKIAEW